MNIAQITTTRKAYSSVLLQASKGEVSPKHQFTNQKKVLNRARILKITKIESTLVVIKFLIALQQKLALIWVIEQLSNLYNKNELGLPILMLEQYGQVFNWIILENQNTKYLKALIIFIIFRNRTSKELDSKPDLDKNKYYKYSYKSSKIYKYKQNSLSYTIIEIAITGLSKT